MKLCCNCSECHAIARCNQCPVENSFYCKACMNVHKQIRSSRDHTFFELNNVCENCEKHIATHQCVDCLHSNIHNTKMIVGSYEDCLFCKDCSILHLKLKSYAKHEVVAVDDESCVVLDENNASLHQSTHFLNANSEKVNKNLIQSDTNPNRYPSSNNSNFKLSWEEFVYVLEDTKDMLCNMLIDLYDIIMTFVPYQQRNWYSIMKGFGIALGIYIIVNLTFGKMPLFFYFIIALILFLFYKHQENELLRSIKSIQNESVDIKNSVNKLKKQTKAPHGNGSSESISVGYDLKKLEQMHPNEFWYDKKKNDSASCRKQKKEQILAAATATLLRTNAEETSIRQKRSMQTIPNVHLDDIPTTLCEDHAKLGTIRNRNRRLKINKNF